MMAQRPAHWPSAYAHSHICVSAYVCVCVRRGWQGSSCWLKAPPSQSLSEKDSREHEPLSGWPRWGHKIRVTWIYRPNMTAKLWSLVWDVSHLQTLGLFSCKWCQDWKECEWDSSHCPMVYAQPHDSGSRKWNKYEIWHSYLASDMRNSSKIMRKFQEEPQQRVCKIFTFS